MTGSRRWTRVLFRVSVNQTAAMEVSPGADHQLSRKLLTCQSRHVDPSDPQDKLSLAIPQHGEILIHSRSLMTALHRAFGISEDYSTQ